MPCTGLDESACRPLADVTLQTHSSRSLTWSFPLVLRPFFSFLQVISKSKFSRASDKKLHFQELRNEIEVMRKMDHANVIKMYEVFESESELYIVMEVCAGGELFDRIKEQPDVSGWTMHTRCPAARE